VDLGGSVLTGPGDSDLQTGSENGDPDPFNPLKVTICSSPVGPLGCRYGFALFPLIYSAGPDGIFDINIGKTSGDANTYQYPTPTSPDLCINPYAQDGNGYYVGQPKDADSPAGESLDGRLNHYDNIHNHRIEAR